MIKIIAAVSQDGIIGKDNKIPWSYPEDMKWFRKQTAGATVIMGRLTYESMGSKPLPKRRNIVVTRSKIEGVECYESLVEAIDLATPPIPLMGSTVELPEQKTPDVWLIGGEQIYREGLKYANEIYLTLIPETVGTLHGVAQFPWISPAQFKVNDYITLEGEREVPIKVAHYIRQK